MRTNPSSCIGTDGLTSPAHFVRRRNTPDPAAGLYGKPTAPAVEDINEYAPHMASALRFDTDKGIANIGGCNALTTSFMEENGVAFTRFKPDTDAGDPYAFINLPSSTVKTDEYKYLLIKVRLDADAPLKGQLYFITDETSIAEPASVHFTYRVPPIGSMFSINLGGNSLYKGLLKTVRYDVFLSVKGTHYADVAYMALFRTKEAAAAFRDNFADYEVEEPEKPTEPTPDYSTYQRADAAAQPADGKLTANGKLNYLYRQYDYAMDFTGSPEKYHIGLDFGFTGLSDALVVDGNLVAGRSVTAPSSPGASRATTTDCAAASLPLTSPRRQAPVRHPAADAGKRCAHLFRHCFHADSGRAYDRPRAGRLCRGY